MRSWEGMISSSQTIPVAETEGRTGAGLRVAGRAVRRPPRHRASVLLGRRYTCRGSFVGTPDHQRTSRPQLACRDWDRVTADRVLVWDPFDATGHANDRTGGVCDRRWPERFHFP